MENKLIRRLSLDKFYEIVTGDANAFYKICMILPTTIKTIVSSKLTRTPIDTVYEELSKQGKNDTDISLALYMLGFSSYQGFNQSQTRTNSEVK